MGEAKARAALEALLKSPEGIREGSRSAFLTGVQSQFPEELRSWFRLETSIDSDFTRDFMRIYLSGLIRACHRVDMIQIMATDSYEVGEVIGRDLRGHLKMELNRLLDELEKMD